MAIYACDDCGSHAGDNNDDLRTTCADCQAEIGPCCTDRHNRDGRPCYVTPVVERDEGPERGDPGFPKRGES